MDTILGESFSRIRDVLSYGEDYGKAFNDEVCQIWKSVELAFANLQKV